MGRVGEALFCLGSVADVARPSVKKAPPANKVNSFRHTSLIAFLFAVSAAWRIPLSIVELTVKLYSLFVICCNIQLLSSFGKLARMKLRGDFVWDRLADIIREIKRKRKKRL